MSFQDFTASTCPEDGPPRLARLRAALRAADVDGVLVPRADAHQGEYVAECDARLAWLTGFTGSAGLAVVLPEVAGIFVDGRYRVQARAQVDTAVFTPVNWPEVRPGTWLRDHLPGGTVAFDPWLHTADEIEKLETSLEGSDITLCPESNFIDAIWSDRPARPAAPVRDHPATLAGRTSGEKRAEIADFLRDAGHRAAVLTLPDSICWLLNIRGGDIPRVPVVQAFAIVHDDGRVDLFSDPAKFAPLGPDPAITVSHTDRFQAALAALSGPVRVDRQTAPFAVGRALDAAGVRVDWQADPCILPKARKTAAELAGTRDAHLRDGAAMVEFLCWFDTEAGRSTLTEIDIVRRLEACRAATGALRDISFDTIAGSGANGAIVHYRVTEATNRAIRPGDIVLVDSGGQYDDGTTDVTRTLTTGPVLPEVKLAATRVLQGMIAISRARWPEGLAGCHLDALARAPLWMAGQDYDHGTGHGVGVYLSVHEGPQRLSRTSDLALEPGMILSNEPGYYREGAFGIRIENLVVVEKAPAIDGGDDRAMLRFETLTHVPIDRRLIDPATLSAAERAWLDGYHAGVAERLRDRVSAAARDWLETACAPL